MSDYIKDNFLPEDQDKATEQIDCYFYNVSLSNFAIRDGDFKKSDVYLENAKRSARDLSELKDKHDKVWFIIKQNEADMKMAEMLVKAYD